MKRKCSSYDSRERLCVAEPVDADPPQRGDTSGADKTQTMSVKCSACTKTVYPGDPQINLDGNVFLKKCAKCKDCGSKLTLTNYHMSKDNDGKWLLLCLTHYKTRFSKTGVYAGADKFQKKTASEVAAAEASSANDSGTPSKVIKSTIWSPQGPSQASDTDYTLERSVTTPDRRPSLKPSIGAASASAERRPSESAGAALLKERRNSLKAVESKANEEISETARRSSIGRTSLANAFPEAEGEDGDAEEPSAVEPAAEPAPEPAVETASEPAVETSSEPAVETVSEPAVETA